MEKRQKDNLSKLSRFFGKKRKKEIDNAKEEAKKLKIPIRQELDDGRVIEIMDFENGRPVYYITENRAGGEMLNNDKLYPGGGSGLNLTGAGQTLGIWDGGGVRTTHNEFTNGGSSPSRVIQKDNPTNFSDHATHVAGTMVAEGYGNVSGYPSNTAKGMSYEAILSAYDWNDDNSEMSSEASSGLNVSQHSYGYLFGWFYGNLGAGTAWYWLGNINVDQTEDYICGFYNNSTREWDLISYQGDEYLIVKSAGNERGAGPAPGTYHYYPSGGYWVWGNAIREKMGGNDGYDCIAHRSLGKNIMTVGAVDVSGNMSSFSSWGPTDDGRIKPDIVAKGVDVISPVANANNESYVMMNGTSMSGPMVAGSVGLILEHQENLNGSVKLLSSTVKALILHTANDTVLGKTVSGPDYRNGWGLMDTEAVINLMTEDNAAGVNFKLIRELILNNLETKEISVTAKGSEPLKATIVWVDPPGTPVSPSLNPPNLMLVNDLDICIVDSNEKTYDPYILNPSTPSSAATKGDNFRDNVEMVIVNNPTNSVYKIVITHKKNLVNNNNQISNQKFSLIISGIE